MYVVVTECFNLGVDDSSSMLQHVLCTKNTQHKENTSQRTLQTKLCVLIG